MGKRIVIATIDSGSVQFWGVKEKSCGTCRHWSIGHDVNWHAVGMGVCAAKRFTYTKDPPPVHTWCGWSACEQWQPRQEAGERCGNCKNWNGRCSLLGDRFAVSADGCACNQWEKRKDEK